MAEFATVHPPDTLHRIARAQAPLNFSEIAPEDATSGKSGNRYDVPGGGVLYAATKVQTCFAETLARFRPTPKMRELLKTLDEDESHFMICGGIPQDWRLQRRIIDLKLNDPLPFLDVEDAGTLTRLELELSATLISLGYEGNLDLGDIRNKDRRLSRAIAEWTYVTQDDQGIPSYAGIRYCSRVDQSEECWAIFDGADVDIATQRNIELTDPDLTTVASKWDLRPF